MELINLPYRKNVCILIFKDKDHLFLGERAGEPGVWQFPQGGVEANSTLEENVLREAQEELGASIDLFKIEAKLAHTHRYDFNVPPEYARGKYRGQDQTFWLVKFIGQDSDIDLEKSEKEFQNWTWASVEEVKVKAEPKRLPAYLVVLDEIDLYFKNYRG